MRVVKAIRQRRSIRNFKSDKIDEKLIEDILNCGRLAPSAKNRQPWHFVAILRKDLVEKIGQIMLDTHKKEDDEYVEKVLRSKNSVIATAKVVKQAPVLILIFQINDDNWSTGDNLSIGGSIENMILRSCELGLGTLWIRDTVYACEEITKAIGWKDKDYVLNCALAIGKPNEKPVQRPRKNLSDITTWIK